MQRGRSTGIELPPVPAVRLVAVRLDGGWEDSRMVVSSSQLPLLPSGNPSTRPSALAVLDERLRGTKFVPLQPRSVLNAPEQTGMDFWSLNPYVGCEFG